MSNVRFAHTGAKTRTSIPHPDGDGPPSETIEAVRFRPTAAVAGERRVLFTPARAIVLAVAIAVAWLLWFIFTAKSVRFEFQPAAETLDIEGGIAVQVGETHLLRRGQYRIQATVSGYYDLQEIVDVGEQSNQVFAFALTKLPGRVRFEIDPVGATIAIAGQDELRTQAPAELLVPAGPQTALVSHPRYQNASVTFDVAGMDQPQTVATALAPNWADVTIPTRPPGASILIDDDDSGRVTPGPVQVLAGEHRVAARLSGYETWTDILHIDAGAEMVLPPVTLERADGLVFVRSTPSGAGITVNGTYRGETPLEIALEPGGNHEVRARKVGYETAAKTVDVVSGQRRRVSFTLSQLQGEVAIQTQPEDAQLWIDGVAQGTATGTRTLPAVAHDIEIKKDGYASYRKTVTPQPGFTQALKVRLLTLTEARLEALRKVRKTSAGQELVLLSPSAIRMGASRREPGRRANETLRNVDLTRLFYLSRHEVTNGQFRAFAKGHSSGAFQNIDLNQDTQPAVRMSWAEAAQYCNWLSRQDGLQPFYREEFGKIAGFHADSLGYRLPTEAEWAWAARHTDHADGPLRFAWGDKLPPPDRHGNYADRSAAHLVARIIFGYNDNYIASAPVGTFAANARGVYDLGGNVAEWMHDYYQISDGSDAVDPLGPAQGEYHVIRGASWQKGTITDLRLSFRDYGTDGRQDLGFRIARFAE